MEEQSNMATLSDLLKQQTQAPQPAIGGQTEQASNILRTKLTGQADAGETAPRQTNIAEQQVAQQEQAQAKQMESQGQILGQQQRQQAADQEQNYRIQAQQIAQQAEQKRQTASLQTHQLMQENLQGLKRLQSDKDVAAYEQVATMSRLSNQRYIHSLTSAAAKAGIDRESNFKQNYYEQVFQDDMQIFKDDIEFKKMMDMDSRSFIRETADMDLDTALKMANMATQQANAQSFYQGIGGLISGGVQAYSAYDKHQATGQATEEE
jgi:hypothetical protein